MLVDTGVGVHSLRKFLASSGLRPDDTEKPLEVVLTHCHFDHSGGAHQFDRVHVHQAEARYVREADKFRSASWISAEEVMPKPSGWKAGEYNVKPATVCGIEENTSFNLGDRSFQVLHLPGHSPGSLGLLDPEHGVLVTGDTLYTTDCGLIDWYPASQTGLMVSSLNRLLQLLISGAVDIVLPGHNEVISAETAEYEARKFIAEDTAQRRARKFFSRQRANLILGANCYFNLPPMCKDWIAN